MPADSVIVCYRLCAHHRESLHRRSIINMALSESQQTQKLYPSLEGISESQVVEPDSSPKRDALPSVDEDLAILHRGCFFWKLRSPTNWFRRRYWLDGDRLRLCYEPSRKPIWSPSHPYVEVLAITDIRAGWQTDVFNRVGRQEEKDRSRDPQRPVSIVEAQCFSIIYGTDNKSLDLVATDEQTAAMWVRALRSLQTFTRSLHHRREDHEWLKQQFQKADKDRSGNLNFDECCKLLELLNIKMDRTEAKKIFQMAGSRTKRLVRGQEVLNAEELVRFYHLLMVRPELEKLFEKYATDNGTCIAATNLSRFLSDEQSMADMDVKLALELIHKFEASVAKERDLMTLAGFTAMMTSSMFDILDESHRSVYQDMDQPLSHYYIASSHNTYLTGNQLTSSSSVEAYIIALEQGCRCLELDVWDGPDGEPIITHGQTLTGTLYVRDVLADAIKPYAFKSSPYPLILSIENHLSPEQQDVLAIRFKDILADSLCRVEVEDLTALPSPNQLKNKVIIKAKKGSGHGPAPTPDAPQQFDDDEEQEEFEQVPAPEAPVPQDIKLKKVSSKHLANLVNVCEAVKFTSFADSREKGKCYHMSSFSEGKAGRLITESAEDFIRHTERQLVRIYPAGSRTGSSNYNPIPFWNVGCQIVALNYQTDGKEKSVYMGRFRSNGNCGYILKPEYLNVAPDAQVIVPEAQGKLRKYLQIRIISGQNLPKVKRDKKDVIDPYVSIEIQGHPDDAFKYKTKHVANNGFNPAWDETTETFLRAPELAVLCVTVKDKDKYKLSGGQFVGSYALPLNSIKSGYRHVPMLTANGDPLPAASVFLHVVFKDLE